MGLSRGLRRKGKFRPATKAERAAARAELDRVALARDRALVVAKAVGCWGKKKGRSPESVIAAYVDTQHELGSPDWWVLWHRLCTMTCDQVARKRKEERANG